MPGPRQQQPPGLDPMLAMAPYYVPAVNPYLPYGGHDPSTLYGGGGGFGGGGFGGGGGGGGFGGGGGGDNLQDWITQNVGGGQMGLGGYMRGQIPSWMSHFLGTTYGTGPSFGSGRDGYGWSGGGDWTGFGLGFGSPALDAIFAEYGASLESGQDYRAIVQEFMDKGFSKEEAAAKAAGQIESAGGIGPESEGRLEGGRHTYTYNDFVSDFNNWLTGTTGFKGAGGGGGMEGGRGIGYPSWFPAI